MLVKSLSNGTQILGVTLSSVDAFDVSVNAATGGVNSACPSIVPGTFQSHSGGGTFGPNQLIITPDSTKAFVTSTARTGSLLAYDVGANAAAGTLSTITLAGMNASTTGTTTGGVTLDSKLLFVGATDKTVHFIDIATATDTGQTSDLGFTPELVAVRPH